MNLIRETFFETTVSHTIDEASGEKNLFIEGIFLESERQNRNGRIYPNQILKREVDRYVKENVDTKRALGELNHPSSPQVNPERVSHLTTSLRTEGNNWIGKAKVLNTPMGNIVRGIVEGGGQLGVSSRGLGTLKESNGVKVVQEDYYLSTIDVVANPSAQEAFVNGLHENKEWIWDNGVLVERSLEVIKDDLESIVKPTQEDIAITFARAMVAIEAQLK